MSMITRQQPGDSPGTPDPDLMPGYYGDGHTSGPGHYLRAERALEMAGDYDLGPEAEQWYLGAAKVHALLALAAATALSRSPEMPAADADAWLAVTREPGDAGDLPRDGAR